MIWFLSFALADDVDLPDADAPVPAEEELAESPAEPPPPPVDVGVFPGTITRLRFFSTTTDFVRPRAKLCFT